MEFQLNNLLPSNWVHAIGVTLFHSLWMGIILSLITSIIILSTRKTSASIRYNLLIAVLGIFVIAIGFVFYNAFAPASVIYTVNNTSETAITPQIVVQSSITGNDGLLNQMNYLMDLWTSHAMQIVLIWFLIICAKCMQLTVGLQSVYYLKTRNVFAAGSHWEHTLAELSERLGITATVKILQSGIAKVPMVAGHFKPVILLPLGLLNGLSEAEVNAIISHELAHIKRRDYLVNILQSIIEIIFFFNPAVLWISKLIKEERENCCDDLALACAGSKQDYIKALLSCQEFQSATPQYAMAITGRKNQLLKRVSRMVFNRGSSLNKIEKTVLTLSLVFTLIFSAAFTQINKSVHHPKSELIVHHEEYLQDTVKRIHKKIVTKKVSAKPGKAGKTKNTQLAEEHQYLLQERKSVVEERTADKKEAEAAIEDAKAAIEDAKFAAMDAKAAAQEAAVSQKQARYNKENAKYAAAVDKYAKAAAKYSHAAEQYSRDLIKYQRKEIPLPPTPPAPPAPVSSPIPPTSPQAPLTFPTPAVPPVPPSVRGYTSSKTTGSKTRTMVNIITNGKVAAPDETDVINAEMEKDGLIKKKGSLSYQLNDDELIINGVKQSDQVHRKYKTKYLKAAQTSLVYDYEMNDKK